MKRRPIVILTVTFSMILAAGVALAQVGTFLPSFTEASNDKHVASDLVPLVEDPEVSAPQEKPIAEEEVPEKEPPVKEEPREVELDKPREPADEPREEPAKEPADTTPPKLVISTPADGAHFGEKALTYAGLTEPGARVFAGEWEADVSKDGEWHLVLYLSQGQNVTTFRAEDAAGNVAKATVTAYLDAAEQGFTAHQKYGTNSEPWEKFIGTAAPGTVIELISKYGNARTVTEGNEWYLKLHFEGLHEATSFPIVLETSTKDRMEFEFTYRPKSVEFSAHQKYGTNSEPWEKLLGTAPPGTVIEVGSSFGNARLVTEGYEWFLKLHFEGLTGPTTFPIVLHSSTGKVMDFMFTYDPQPIEFTAHQKYGSCSEPEPYDIFHGTGEPGATVTVTWQLGSMSTVAGENGHWDLKVFFTGAIHGEVYLVTVGDSQGHAKTFEFVSYAGGDK